MRTVLLLVLLFLTGCALRGAAFNPTPPISAAELCRAAQIVADHLPDEDRDARLRVIALGRVACANRVVVVEGTASR